MSRVSTQSDTDPLFLKINMMQNNLYRIHSQNQKLQELLTHREQLHKLKEVAETSANNWKRLAALAENVQELYQSVSIVREKAHQSLSEQTEQIHKSLLSEIQRNKIIVKELSAKLMSVKERERNKMQLQLSRQKSKIIDRLNKRKQECRQLLKKAQDQHCYKTNEEIEILYQQYQQEMNQEYHQCRISLGHLENLVAFWQQEQHHQSITDAPLFSIASTNFQALSDHLERLETYQKRIKSEVDWLKSRARKQRNQAKQLKQSKYKPQQTSTLVQLKIQVQSLEPQLQGLDTLCQQKSLTQQKTFSQAQINLLIKIKERLKNLHLKIQQYSSFYNQSS